MSKRPTYEELEQLVRDFRRAESKQKQAQDTLREYKARFDLLVEQTHAYIWEVDKEGLYTELGSTAETITGYRPEDIIGIKHFYDLHPDDGREEFRSAAFEVFARKATFRDLKNRIQTKSGEVIWVGTSSIPILDANNNLTGYWGMDIDITERMRSEDALRESEKKHKTLVNNIPGMIYRAFPDWSADIISGSEAISGYTESELNSKENNWLSIIHHSDKDMIVKGGTELTQIQKDIVQTYRIKHKEGHLRWVEDRKSSIFSDHGRLLWIDGVVFDITERKQAEEELLLEKNKLQTALQTIKQLSGMLPICSHCKKIRDDKGYWSQIESYIEERSEADFSHSICPGCAKNIYPDFDIYDD